MKKLIRGGRVVDPAAGIDKKLDVLVEGEKIAGLLSPSEGAELASDSGVEVFAANGMIVAPGFIDIHVHLREPGYEGKAKPSRSGTDAAVAGGFSAVACMANTQACERQSGHHPLHSCSAPGKRGKPRCTPSAP